ncbi:MAG TPA: MarR family transcriptional regulator [Pseudogracilibacillus sp.]|nr:MarR family transcriptional regulator [Pseudogracilibacillus sp.]
MASLDEKLSLKLFVVMNKSLGSVKKRVQQEIKTLGLNPTEFAVLELLYNKGNHTIQKIGEKVLIASSSITYVVDKLEGKGYVKREPCPKDRRITYAVITDEGQQLMDDIFPKHRKDLSNIYSGLTEQEKETAIELLKKLGYHAEEA